MSTDTSTANTAQLFTVPPEVLRRYAEGTPESKLRQVYEAAGRWLNSRRNEYGWGQYDRTRFTSALREAAFALLVPQVGLFPQPAEGMTRHQLARVLLEELLSQFKAALPSGDYPDGNQDAREQIAAYFDEPVGDLLEAAKHDVYRRLIEALGLTDTAHAIYTRHTLRERFGQS